MEATATFRFDRSYFEIYYSEWRRYRSRWRRFAIPAGLGMMIAGISLLWIFPEDRILGIALILGSLYQACDIATHRSRWIRDRLKNLPHDKFVKVVFHKDYLELETPNSEGKLYYDALTDIVGTPRGLFLVVNTGLSIFVPRATVQPTDAWAKLVESLLCSNQERPSATTAGQ